MSLVDTTVTWYANNQRAIVHNKDGKWWVAPNGFGQYAAIRDDADLFEDKTGKAHVVPTLRDAFHLLLGERAEEYLVGVAA